MHGEHTMTPESDAGRAIAAAARTINQSKSLDETLQTIAEVARDSVPGFDQVGISTVHKDGEVVTRAFAGDLVLRLDEVQYSLGEGPCVETLRSSDVALAPKIRQDKRWPRYVPEAVALGVQSQMAVKLYLDEQGTLGGINFYSTTSDEVSPDAQALADLFAAHSAIALGHAYQRETLNQALESRKVIGQAIGILMERYAMNEDRAFAFLVRASQQSNVKLRDIAQELVDQRNSK